MQGGHLHQGRAAAGLCGGCAGGGARGDGVRPGRPRPLPVLRRGGPGRRFCDPLEVHLPHRPGHRAGGYQARRLPGQAAQGRHAAAEIACGAVGVFVKSHFWI